MRGPAGAQRLLELDAAHCERRAADDQPLRVDGDELLERVAAHAVVAAREEAHRRRQLLDRTLGRGAGLAADDDALAARRGPDPFALCDGLHEIRAPERTASSAPRTSNDTLEPTFGRMALSARMRRSQLTPGMNTEHGLLIRDLVILDAQSEHLRASPLGAALAHAARADLEDVALGGLRVSLSRPASRLSHSERELLMGRR